MNLDYIGILDEFFEGLSPAELKALTHEERKEIVAQLTREEGWDDLDG